MRMPVVLHIRLRCQIVGNSSRSTPSGAADPIGQPGNRVEVGRAGAAAHRAVGVACVRPPRAGLVEDVFRSRIGRAAGLFAEVVPVATARGLRSLEEREGRVVPVWLLMVSVTFRPVVAVCDPAAFRVSCVLALDRQWLWISPWPRAPRCDASARYPSLLRSFAPGPGLGTTLRASATVCPSLQVSAMSTGLPQSRWTNSMAGPSSSAR